MSKTPLRSSRHPSETAFKCLVQALESLPELIEAELVVEPPHLPDVKLFLGILIIKKKKKEYISKNRLRSLYYAFMSLLAASRFSDSSFHEFPMCIALELSHSPRVPFPPNPRYDPLALESPRTHQSSTPCSRRRCRRHPRAPAATSRAPYHAPS